MAAARAWGLRARERRTWRRSCPACPGARGTRGRRCRRPLKCRAPGTSPGPTPATSAAPLTWARACTGRGYLPRKERAARLSWAKPPWRHDLRAWANFFLPVRAQRPGRSGIRRSAGVAPSRNGERSWATRGHARPVPGRMKARHLPKCNGATSKPPRERGWRLTPMFFLAMPRGRAAPGDPPPLPMGSPGSLESHGPRSSPTHLRATRPTRRRLLWARSGAAFRAAFGQGKGRSAGAHSQRCAAQPPRSALKSAENHLETGG